jgi:hypothetical protein
LHLGEAIGIIEKYPSPGRFEFPLGQRPMNDRTPPHPVFGVRGRSRRRHLYLVLFGFLYRVQRPDRSTDHPVVPFLGTSNVYLARLLFADVWLEVHIYFIVSISIVMSRWVEEEELRGRGLPGVIAGTPGARRAAARALYRPMGRA